MKQKIISLVVLGIIIGAGSFATASLFTDTEFNSFFLQKLTKQQNTAVSAEKQEYQPSHSSADTTLSSSKAQLTAQKYQNTYLSTEQQIMNRTLDITGQWGLTNNPASQGMISGSIIGTSFQATSSDKNSANYFELTLVLADTTFSGKIIIRKTQQNPSNTDATAVIPLYGVYSITDGFIKAFWIHGVDRLTTNLAPNYEGWFFGTID